MTEGTKECKLFEVKAFLICDKNNSARLCVGGVGGQGLSVNSWAGYTLIFFLMLKWIQGALEMDEHIGFECENSKVSSSAQWLSQDPRTCHCWNPHEGLNVYIASAFDLPC